MLEVQKQVVYTVLDICVHLKLRGIHTSDVPLDCIKSSF